jgi:hypothetical protein
MANAKETLNGFEEITNEFQQVLSSFTTEEINTIPFEGSWTAAQTGRHLFKSFEHMPQLLNGKVEKTERAADEKMKMIDTDFLNFSVKFKAAEMLVPEDTRYDKEQLLSSFKEKVSQILATAKTLDPSETCLGFEIPGYGHMTRWEWMHFSIAHTKRHLHQLKNIRKAISSKKMVQ